MLPEPGQGYGGPPRWIAATAEGRTQRFLAVHQFTLGRRCSHQLLLMPGIWDWQLVTGTTNGGRGASPGTVEAAVAQTTQNMLAKAESAVRRATVDGWLREQRGGCGSTKYHLPHPKRSRTPAGIAENLLKESTPPTSTETVPKPQIGSNIAEFLKPGPIYRWWVRDADQEKTRFSCASDFGEINMGGDSNHQTKAPSIRYVQQYQ